MEFLLLGLVGIAVTWAVVDAVRDDGGDDGAPEPEPPVDPDLGLNLVASSNALLEGGNGDDTIQAGESESAVVGDATIRGGGGNDSFSLAVTDSEIFGGAGNDTFAGRAGDSEIFGGEGDDAFDFAGGYLDVFGGELEVYGGAGDDTFTGVYQHQSQIHGGEGADVFDVETFGNSSLLGGLGNDTITVGGERSFIYGGEGDDVIDAGAMWTSSIYGGDGNDLVIVQSNSQGEGGDSVYGGLGDDTLRIYAEHEMGTPISLLHGGAGNDVYEVVFNPSDYVPLNPSNDEPVLYRNLVRIEDFQPGRDQLHLDIGERAIGAAPTLSLHATSLGTSVNITYTAIHHDDDGTEVPMQVRSEVWLAGVQGVTMDDIRLVDLPPAA